MVETEYQKIIYKVFLNEYIAEVILLDKTISKKF